MQPGLVLDEVKDHIANIERLLLNIPVVVTTDAL
jgi:hypothetical protein